MNKEKISKVGIALIEHFLATGETITYSELCDLVDFKVCPIRIGAHLGYISQMCIDRDLPIITALVVKKGERVCSDSFFKCYFPEVKDKESFLIEYYETIKKCPEWEFLLIELKKSLKMFENKNFDPLFI